MNFESYLQSTIDSIQCYMRDPRYRATGKTYGMCKALLAATLDGPDRILILGTTYKHLENIFSTLTRVADATDTPWRRVNKFELRIHKSSIIFEIPKNAHKHAREHPTPHRFIDHFTEEVFVLEGLQKLKNDLAILKYGDRTTNKEKLKNRMQYVLFDPVAVEWDIGLQKCIEEAGKMHLPIAVKSKEIAVKVQRMYPDVNIIVKGE